MITRSLNCRLMSCTKHIYVAQEVFIFDQTQRCTVLQSVYFETVFFPIFHTFFFSTFKPKRPHIRCLVTNRPAIGLFDRTPWNVKMMLRRLDNCEKTPIARSCFIRWHHSAKYWWMTRSSRNLSNYSAVSPASHEDPARWWSSHCGNNIRPATSPDTPFVCFQFEQKQNLQWNCAAKLCLPRNFQYSEFMGQHESISQRKSHGEMIKEKPQDPQEQNFVDCCLGCIERSVEGFELRHTMKAEWILATLISWRSVEELRFPFVSPKSAALSHQEEHFSSIPQSIFFPQRLLPNVPWFTE